MQVAEVVTARGWPRIYDLADHFGVSTMTIHRDLDHLDSHGMLRKVRAGRNAPPSQRFERNVALRRVLKVAGKQSVALAGVAWRLST